MAQEKQARYFDFDLTITNQHFTNDVWKIIETLDAESCKKYLKLGAFEKLQEFEKNGDDIHVVTMNNPELVSSFLQKIGLSKVKVFGADSKTIVPNFKRNIIQTMGIYQHNDIKVHSFHDDNKYFVQEVVPLVGLFADKGKKFHVYMVDPGNSNFLGGAIEAKNLSVSEYRQLHEEILDAVNKNEVEKAKNLLARPEVNIRYFCGYSEEKFIIRAALTGNIEMINMLLEKDKTLIEEMVNAVDGLTPLYYTLHEKQFDAAKFLLGKGAKIDALYKPEVLIRLCQDQAIQKIVEFLLSQNIDINRSDSTSNTIFHYGIDYFEPEFLEKLITQHQANINLKNASQQTPLHIAANIQAMPQTITVLLKHISNINELDDCGRSALHIAANNGHFEIVKLLVEYGADMTMRDSAGKTAYDLAKEPQLDYDSDNDDPPEEHSEITAYLNAKMTAAQNLSSIPAQQKSSSQPSNEPNDEDMDIDLQEDFSEPVSFSPPLTQQGGIIAQYKMNIELEINRHQSVIDAENAQHQKNVMLLNEMYKLLLTNARNNYSQAATTANTLSTTTAATTTITNTTTNTTLITTTTGIADTANQQFWSNPQGQGGPQHQNQRNFPPSSMNFQQ